MITGGSGSGKANSLFNLSSQQPDINNSYSYGKDPYEAKYPFLINNRKNTGLKHLNDFQFFIEYSKNINDIHKIIEEYNPKKM